MPQTERCSSLEELREYLSGGLSPDRAGSLAKHLDECDRCAALIDREGDKDTILEALKTVGPEDEDVEELVERMTQRLGLQDTNALPQGETLVHPGGSLPPLPIDDSWGDQTEDVFDFLAPAQGPDEMGRLGGYRVLRVLGAGGMGVVFEGEDPNLRRKVALKVMKREMAVIAASRDRFVREAQVTAALEHDNVVTIYQVGEERGVPFLAMQMLKGEALDERLEKGAPLSQKEMLRIGRETALGLAAAHEQGLIHRDIKPSNLWLDSTANDRVKILDFGLARAQTSDAKITHSGTIIGTPAYMPPEQARGEPAEARSDLFSLGCVLYRLFTGELPFKGRDTISTLIAVASKDPTPPQKLSPNVPPALAKLIMQLLSKEIEDRPASASEVAERLLAIEKSPDSDKVVLRQKEAPGSDRGATQVRRRKAPAAVQKKASPSVARGKSGSRAADAPPAKPQRATQSTPQTPGKKQVQRKPPEKARQSGGIGKYVAMGALLLLVGVGILFAGTIFRFVTNQGALVIEVNDPSIEVVVKQNGVVVGDPTTKRKFTLSLEKGARGEILVVDNEGLQAKVSEFKLTRGQMTRVRITQQEVARVTKPKNPGPKPGPDKKPDDRNPGPATGERAVPKVGDPLTLEGHKGNVTSVAISADGKRIVSGSHDQTVKVWDATTGKEALTLKGHTAEVSSVAISADGKRIVSGSYDQTVKVWDATTGKEALTLKGHTDRVNSVAISADGKRIASGSADGTVRVWDATTGNEALTLKGHAFWVNSVAFSADGKRIVSGSRDQTIKVWDATTGKEALTLKGHAGWVNSVAFSADGRHIVSASGDETVNVWDSLTGQKTLTFKGHKRWLNSVAFSPDGKRVVSGSHDPTVRVWNSVTGQEALALKGHGSIITSVAFSPDGKRIVSGSFDHTVKVWDIGTGQSSGSAKGQTDRSGSRD